MYHVVQRNWLVRFPHHFFWKTRNETISGLLTKHRTERFFFDRTNWWMDGDCVEDLSWSRWRMIPMIDLSLLASSRNEWLIQGDGMESIEESAGFEEEFLVQKLAPKVPGEAPNFSQRWMTISSRWMDCGGDGVRPFDGCDWDDYFAMEGSKEVRVE